MITDRIVRSCLAVSPKSERRMHSGNVFADAMNRNPSGMLLASLLTNLEVLTTLAWSLPHAPLWTGSGSCSRTLAVFGRLELVLGAEGATGLGVADDDDAPEGDDATDATAGAVADDD